MWKLGNTSSWPNVLLPSAARASTVRYRVLWRLAWISPGSVEDARQGLWDGQIGFLVAPVVVIVTHGWFATDNLAFQIQTIDAFPGLNRGTGTNNDDSFEFRELIRDLY